jgi:hypothetical protein
MTTIVGIFDDAWNVEKAIEQLAAAGFEDTVFDEAIVAEQPGSAGAIPFRAPGSAPERALGENAPNLISKPDRRTIAFIHDGKFIFVKSESERADQAMKILRDCNSTRVTRHD